MTQQQDPNEPNVQVATLGGISPSRNRPHDATVDTPTAPGITNTPLWRRLNWWRWLPGLVALVPAFYAERLAEEARTTGLSAPPALSWGLFGLAALVFAVATWPVYRLLPAIPLPFRSARALPRPKLYICLWLLGGAVLCSLLSVPLFISLNANNQNPAADWWANTGSWLLYIASLLLFGAAFVVWERSREIATATPGSPPPGDQLPRRVEWTLMGALLVLALVLRLPELNSAPPGLWFDEAQNGIVAQGLRAPDAVHLPFIADLTQMGAMYFYFLGVLLNIVGTAIWPLRLLPALGGALIAPLLYLLASRLYGWRVGLAAGGLVAVSAWNITFSRFGMDSMFTVALDVAAILCFMQAMRTGRLGFYAGAGVLMGLALQMYYVALIVPLVFIVVLAHRLVTERMRLVRAVRVGVVVLTLGAVMAFLPLGVFAVQHPDIYNSRVNTVSVFNQMNGDWSVLTTSLNKHLLMFNFAGDANGRHNLPGQPMLDWLTAMLFITGLGACVLRAWRWQYFFPVAWFIGELSGGVLSVPFEAPQSHRTLEDSVVTALLAGIFLGELWGQVSKAIAGRSLSRQASVHPGGASAAIPARRAAAVTNLQAAAPNLAGDKPAKEREGQETATGQPKTLANRRLLLASALSIVGIAAVVGWIATMTVHRYFDLQANDMGVWQDMFSPQAEAGAVLRDYSKTADVYITPVYYGLPPMNYLAPGLSAQEWQGMQALPLSGKRDVVLVLDPPSVGDISALARMYPHARFVPLHAPSNTTPIEYTIFIPASDITGLHGVHASLFQAGAKTPSREQTLQTLSMDPTQWNGASGTLRLSGTLKVQDSALYSFSWVRSNGSASAVNGQVSIDGFSVGSNQPIDLGVGLHSVVITSTLQSGGAAAELIRFQSRSALPPTQVPASLLFDPRKIEPHGLTAYIRGGDTFDNPPQVTQVDPTISFYFQNTPVARPYTIEWLGKLYVPQAGTYLLGTEQLSKSRLLLDGKELIVNQQENNYMEASVSLTAGLHDIHLYFEDFSNYSHMYLYWTPPGRGRSIIPSAFLWPVMGEYPAAPESGPFPTLDQSDGSVLPSNPSPAGTSGQGQGDANGQVTPPAQPPTPAPSVAAPTNPPAQPGDAIKPEIVLGTSGDDQLARPQAAGADSVGNLYVLTIADGKVHKYDPSGKPLTSWAVTGNSGKILTEASALLVNSNTVSVLDAGSASLVNFDAGGRLIGRANLCQCYYPRGIALARDGNYWVADTGGARVIKVDANGKVLAKIDARGSNPGQFIEPAGVWESPQGTLYVADIGNARVQSFTPDLKPLAQWPVGKSVARDGNRLVGDAAGNVLVTEGESHSIVQYNSQGQELHRWSYVANGAVATPAGIAALGNNRFLVLFPNSELGVVFTAGK